MFNDIQVDRELYQAAIETPFINWYARVGSGASEAGFFFAGLDAFDRAPAGWQEHEIALGTDPNLTPVYVTRRLRAVVLGVRKQVMIEDDSGNRHYYPQYTKKNARVSGKFTSRTQVALLVAEPQSDANANSLTPFDTTVRVLTANGMTKGLSWSNNKRSQFGANMDFGVEELISRHTEEKAREAEIAWLPWQCLWYITLQPQFVERRGERVPNVINTGHGSAVNPFTVSMEGGLAPVYTGAAMFAEFQAIRKNQIVDWENEWDVGRVDEASDGNYGGDAPAIVEDNMDEIPF